MKFKPIIYIRLLVGSIIVFYPITVLLEFTVYVLVFGDEIEMEYFTGKNLLKAIALINLLTFPLAQIYGYLFMILFYDNSLFYLYSIILIEIIVILLELILLPEMVNRDYQISNIKFRGTICIANVVSMVVGFVLYGLYWPLLLFF